MATMLRFFFSEQRRRRLHAAARRFARGSRGNFTILFAFTAPILIIFIGMGVDYWVALSDKARLDTAADAASIAAVNTAVSYYKANSGTETGSTLTNNAIAAGIAQAQKVFAADLGSTQLVGPVTPAISMTCPNSCAGLTFDSTVNWSGQVATHFGPLVGVSSLAISGSSSATAGLHKYLDFYVVVDTSGSMGIPTSTADQQILIANNPDNAIEQANGYLGGCQFACHFPGYNGYNYASNPATYLPLKLNSVASAIQALISSATNTEASTNQTNEFRIGIYPFIVDAIQAAPLSANFTAASALVTPPSPNLPQPLGAYLDGGGTNGGMGSGGTHFENLWGDISPYMQPAGTGLSQLSTSPYIVLITDGVDNSQTYINGNFSGSYPQTPNISLCTNAKNAGYTVAVILIPYVPIVDPETIWNDEDGVVNNLINTNSIAPVMQSCASSGFFFSAATSADITNAMLTIFYEAINASRITQ